MVKEAERGRQEGTERKVKKPFTIERLRKIIPHVTNKHRRRDFASRLQKLVKAERTKKRRARQAAEARGETVRRRCKSVPRFICNGVLSMTL